MSGISPAIGPFRPAPSLLVPTQTSRSAEQRFKRNWGKGGSPSAETRRRFVWVARGLRLSGPAPSPSPRPRLWLPGSWDPVFLASLPYLPASSPLSFPFCHLHTPTLRPPSPGSPAPPSPSPSPQDWQTLPLRSGLFWRVLCGKSAEPNPERPAFVEIRTYA